MELEYSIKNFRVFDKEGTSFTLKPVTLLTGANCAGKSTLVKSIKLLKGYFDKCSRYKFDAPGAVDISFEEDNININGIDSVINNKSGDYKDVVFTLTKPSITKNVKYSIEYTFASREGDYFNNGCLKRLRFSCVIEDKSDVFLDVAYENDDEIFQTFNLRGNLLQSFLREMDLQQYLMFKDTDTSSAPHADVWQTLLYALAERVKKNPLNSHLPLCAETRVGAKDNMDDEGALLHGLSVSNNFKCLWAELELVHQSKVLLYFPILERIGKMSYQEVTAFLLDNKRIEQINSLFPKKQRASLNGWTIDNTIQDVKKTVEKSRTFPDIYLKSVKSIINDFKNSPYSYFVDYYRAKEREFLENMIINDNYRFSSSSEFKSLLWRFITKPYDYDNLSAITGTERYSFALLYNIIVLHQKIDEEKDSLLLNAYKDAPLYFESPDNNHTIMLPPIYDYYRHFIIHIVQSLMRIEDFKYVSINNSFICPVQRSYSIYDKTNSLSRLLVSYIAARERYMHDNSGKAFTFIDKWVKELGIGKSVVYELNKEKTDIKVMVKNNRDEFVSTADLGHGVTQLLSILINIEWQIYEKWFTDIRTITLEEPEISLHPSWQSALGRIFYDAAVNYGIHFIVETHSEYLIRATQAIVANTVETKEELKNIPFVVYYIENGGKAYDMEYQVSGRFNKPFGTGFFDEAGKSSLEIIRKERRMANGKDA